jgi:hypothetical protein
MDQEFDLIDPSAFKKMVEFVARVYISDSKRYQPQSEYWLNYLTGMSINAQDGTEDEMISESKRLESLRAAYMLDNGDYKVASVVLDFLA